MEPFGAYFNKGIENYEKGNYQDARDCFTKCIELKPDSPNVYINRGLMNYMLDQYSTAIEDFDKALALDPANLEAYFNRGLAKKESGQFEKALEDFNLVKIQCADYPDLDKAIDTVKKMMTGEAMSLSFLRKISHDGGNPEVALNRGKIAEQNRDYSGAINDYTNAISYNKDYVEAYLERARCYSILKQYDKAIADYEVAEKYVKDKDAIKALIGNLFAAINKFDISLRYLDEAIQLNPKDSKYYYFRAQTKIQMGQNEGAFFDLTKCLELDPNDINAIQQRGLLRGNMKDFEGAISDFNKIIELVPDNGMSYYNRAIIYYKIGEKEKCLIDLNKAFSLGFAHAEELIKKISSNNTKLR